MVVSVESGAQKINWNAQGRERILQNVRNLICTRQFEVAFDRGRGIDPDVMDRPAGDVLGKLTNEIIELLAIYEPRATLQEVVANEDGTFAVRVTI